MTPADHIERAEDLMNEWDELREQGLGGDMPEVLLAAIAHALIATAVENGVPHGTASAGPATDAG